MMPNPTPDSVLHLLTARLAARGLTVSCAESCTGGLLAAGIHPPARQFCLV